MAVVCGSTSVTFPSSSATSSLSSHKNANAKSSFVGFQLALPKPSIRTSVPLNSWGSFRVRCQDLSIVPKDERFMFEESEVNGPVKPSSVYYFIENFSLEINDITKWANKKKQCLVL